MISIYITPYERRYREAIHTLMFYSPLTHVHLDWFKVAQWLETGNPIVYLAWHQQRLVGILGASESLNHASWIRLAAVDSQFLDGRTIMEQLWQNLYPELLNQSVRSVSALVMNNWLEPHLRDLGFDHMEQVITLFRKDSTIPFAVPSDVWVDVAYGNSLEQIVTVDNAAFQPPWQLSLREMHQALRLSAICTMAGIGKQIVGYQLSTRHNTKGHLARLAVAPGMQGKGIGKLLLVDLIQRFVKRGVRSITVNTQLSNEPSKNLYFRYGFKRNGFDLPVWNRVLHPNMNHTS